MAGRKKGFDPLSSLFEIPDPAAGVPLSSLDASEDGSMDPSGPGRTFEMTDPFYQPPPGTEVTEAVDRVSADFPPETTQVSVRPPALEAPEPANFPLADAPALPQVPSEELPTDSREALPASAVAAGPSDEEKARIAKALVAAATARGAAKAPPKPAAGPTDEEKARIAKALVEAAAAKAAAGKAASAKAASAKAAAAKAPKVPKANRLDSLAARSRRPQSALEAARAAAAAEDIVHEEEAAAAAAGPSDADKARIAKALVAQATARAASAAPAPSGPSEDDKLKLARTLAAQAAARAAASAPSAAPSAPAAGPSDADKARIAKALVAQATARAASQAAEHAPVADPAEAVEEDAAPQSRMDKLAARSSRPQSALEAARAAAAVEEAARERSKRLDAERQRAQARQREHSLTDQIQKQLPHLLPGAKAMYVANAMITDERDLLGDLWRAHRAAFVEQGELERAVAAVAVIQSLAQTPQGQLVAAHVVTDVSDYLVWMDLESQRMVAAFANARAFFASGQ